MLSFAQTGFPRPAGSWIRPTPTGPPSSSQILAKGAPRPDVTGRCDLFTVDLPGSPILVADCGESIVGNTTAHLHRGPTNASPIDLDLSGGILPNGGLFQALVIRPEVRDDLRRRNGVNVFDLGFPNGAVVGGGPDPCVTTPDKGCYVSFHSVTVRKTRNGPLYELFRGGSRTNDFRAPDGRLVRAIVEPRENGGFRFIGVGTGDGGEFITVTDEATGDVREFTLPASGGIDEPL